MELSERSLSTSFPKSILSEKLAALMPRMTEGMLICIF